MDGHYDITDDVKRDVLQATDLVSLIGAATALKKSGASFKGCCPFHGEKTPSFYVHPAKGFYYCFGCGAKGDAITFVRETERLEFPEAVAYLARLAGIALPSRRTGTRAERGKDTRLSEAIAAAARFFRDQLRSHAAARDYLEKRGIGVEEALAYGFGASPEAWEALKAELSRTFPEELLVSAGLLTRHPDSGRVYDRFRNRLMVEIRDGRGEVLGFGARALGDDQPKYLNSPESSRFSKGKLLYGLDRAREAIRTSGTAILVEGYFDRIAMETAGLANAVASMGTALTGSQADLLARHAETVIVAYDGDAAGRAATLKAFPLLLERSVQVRQLVLPDGQDPDSYLRSRGKEALAEEVGKALPLLHALLRTVPSEGSDPNQRAARLNEAVGILSAAQDRIVRHELLTGLSRGSGVPLSVLVPGAGKKAAPQRVPALKGTPATVLPGAEEKVLTILLAKWPESAEGVQRVMVDLFEQPQHRELLEGLKQLPAEGGTLDFSTLESHVGVGAGSLAARLLLQGGEGLELIQLRNPLLILTIRYLEKRARNLQSDIQSAVDHGDSESLDRLHREKQGLVGEIARLKQDLRGRRE